MIILINTSDKICKIRFIEDESNFDYEWQSDMMLARGLIGYLDKLLKIHDKAWSDISAIGVFEGPGSFTGIRIGLTVMNTIAGAQAIPIVGGRGEDWQDVVMDKIKSGTYEKIVLPYYDRGANITIPRK